MEELAKLLLKTIFNNSFSKEVIYFNPFKNEKNEYHIEQAFLVELKQIEIQILMKRQISLLLISLLLIACGNKNENSDTVSTELKPSQVVGIGKVVPQGGVVNLAAQASGIVNEIHVKAGDNVKMGDIILTLYSNDEQLSVKEADIRIKSQELSIESANIALAQERITHQEQQRLLNDAKDNLVEEAYRRYLKVATLLYESAQDNYLRKFIQTDKYEENK